MGCQAFYRISRRELLTDGIGEVAISYREFDTNELIDHYLFSEGIS
jgi:hypothetical protein